MKLSIIIVNWNSEEYLERCLQSIASQPISEAYEVIVIDNASAGNDVERLVACFPHTVLIRSTENLGFARANNRAAGQARGQWLLFLNPDTEVVGQALATLLARASTLPDAGVAGCRLLNSDGTVQLSAIQKFPTIIGQALDAERLLRAWPDCPLWDLGPLFSEPAEPVQVDAISGACMLIRREVFKRIGQFSEDYFMYSEDIDLNRKAVSAGFRNYYVGSAVVVHHGGKSSARQEVQQWSTIMKCRALLQYFATFHGASYAIRYRVAMASLSLLRISLLIAAYPVGPLLQRTSRLHGALKKWAAVLKWALSEGRLSVPGYSAPSPAGRHLEQQTK